MSKKSKQRIADLESKIAGLQVSKDNTSNDPVWTTRNPGGLLGLAYSQSHSGIAVSWQASLAVTALYSCIKCISEDIAKIPLEMRACQPNGGSKLELKHPLVTLLRKPNYWQTPFEFWTFTIAAHQLRGNAFVYIQRDDAGNPVALIPINPDRVTVMFSERGMITYSLTHPMISFGSIVCGVEDMIHLKGFMVGDAITGVTPIVMAADAIGLALATQRHAALLFGQGTQLGGVLEHPGKLSKEAGERVASSWTAAYAGGTNAHKVGVLEEGMQFRPLTMSAVDSALIESRKFSVIEIARIFRVPLHKIGDLEHATFSNIDAQSQQYLDDTLMPVTTQIEQALASRLLFDDEIGKYNFRFDYDEMLRADMKTRFAAYQQGALTGWMNVNEIRARENEESIGPEGDVYRYPLNLSPGATPGVNTADVTGQSDDPDNKNES